MTEKEQMNALIPGISESGLGQYSFTNTDSVNGFITDVTNMLNEYENSINITYDVFRDEYLEVFRKIRNNEDVSMYKNTLINYHKLTKGHLVRVNVYKDNKLLYKLPPMYGKPSSTVVADYDYCSIISSYRKLLSYNDVRGDHFFTDIMSGVVDKIKISMLESFKEYKKEWDEILYGDIDKTTSNKSQPIEIKGSIDASKFDF